MIYIKSILAGLAAVLLAIPTIVGATVIAMFVRQWLFETRGGAVSISSGLILPGAVVLAVLTFTAGFIWEFKRAST
jgi:hypothetical protein